jgi:hypothetical protein
MADLEQVLLALSCVILSCGLVFVVPQRLNELNFHPWPCLFQHLHALLWSAPLPSSSEYAPWKGMLDEMLIRAENERRNIVFTEKINK